MSGYARAHRGRWDHPLFKNKQEAAVWAWMTDTARWRAHEFQTRFGVVRLGRGQLLVSERTIADDFGLGRQQVRRLMDSLENASMINRDATHSASRAGTIVTIKNYERYQSDGEEVEARATQGQPIPQPKDNPRPTQDQPTREEREKGEEREEESPSDSAPDGAINAAEPRPAMLLSLVPTPPSSDDVAEAFSRFERLRSEFYPAGRSLTLTADRRKGISARLRDAGGLDGWDRAMATIRGSPFLRGDKGDWPFVTITFLLSPASFRRIIEGEFNDDRPNAGTRRVDPRVPASPVDAFSIAIAASGLG